MREKKERNLLNIATRDAREIDKVCEVVARKNPIRGIEQEDLKQELVVKAIQIFTNHWDDNKMHFKNRRHRLNNINLFIKMGISRYVYNVYHKLNANKRAANINTTSLSDREHLIGEVEEIVFSDFLDIYEDMDITDNESKIVDWISKADKRTLNLLDRENINFSMIASKTGISEREAEEALHSLKNNYDLYNYLRAA